MVNHIHCLLIALRLQFTAGRCSARSVPESAKGDSFGASYPHPVVYGVSIQFWGVLSCRPARKTGDISARSFSAIPAYRIPLEGDRSTL